MASARKRARWRALGLVGAGAALVFGGYALVKRISNEKKARQDA